MKYLSFFLLILISFSGCEEVPGIFKTGVGLGMLSVIMIGLIVFVVAKIFARGG